MPQRDTYGGTASGTPDPEDLLTRKEAADLIGYSISSIRRWERVGVLPQLRTATGRVRYRRADVLAAVEPRPVADSAA